MNLNLGDLVYDKETLGMVTWVQKDKITIDWYGRRIMREEYYVSSEGHSLRRWRQHAIELVTTSICRK